jgi:hypothetical protein
VSVSTVKAAPEVLISPRTPTPKAGLTTAKKAEFSSYLQEGSMVGSRVGKNVFLKSGGSKGAGDSPSSIGSTDSPSIETESDGSVRSPEFFSEDPGSLDSGILPAVRAEADLPSDPSFLNPVDAALEAAAIAASTMLSENASTSSPVVMSSNAIEADAYFSSGDSQGSSEKVPGESELAHSVPMPTLQAAMRRGIAQSSAASESSLSQTHTEALSSQPVAVAQVMTAPSPADSRQVIFAKVAVPQTPSDPSLFSKMPAPGSGELISEVKSLTPSLGVTGLQGFKGSLDLSLATLAKMEPNVSSVRDGVVTFRSTEILGEQLSSSLGLGPIEFETAQNVAAQNVAAQNVAAQNVAAQNVAAQNVAAQNVAAQNVAAQNVAAQNVAAQNVAAQNVAAQNVAAQNVVLNSPRELFGDSAKNVGGSDDRADSSNFGEGTLIDGAFSQRSTEENQALGQGGVDPKFGDAGGFDESASENSRNQGGFSRPPMVSNPRQSYPKSILSFESPGIGARGAEQVPQMSVLSPEAKSSEVRISSPSGESESSSMSINVGSQPFYAPANQSTEASGVKVQPPVEVNRADIWDAVREAIMKVSSENPSHISVELRLGDGSTVGVELRMGSSGLEAFFRSESNALLKSLESQWVGFLSKESPDLRVASAVFEGRSSLGSFSDSGRNGRELRQQMEDSADAATLGAAKRSLSVGKKPGASNPSS